jgi:hypothetical protein
MVRWQSTDEGSGLREHVLTVFTDGGRLISNATLDAKAASALLELPAGLPNGALVSIHVSAVDHAGQSSSQHMDCKFAALGPELSTLAIENSTSLGKQTFAIRGGDAFTRVCCRAVRQLVPSTHTRYVGTSSSRSPSPLS